MSTRIVVRHGETMQQALRRFKKQLQLSRQMWEVRRRESPEDGTQKRRAKQFRKRLKAREATLLAQQAGEQPVESLVEARRQFRARRGKP